MALREITVQPQPSDTHVDTRVLLDGRWYAFSFYTNKIANCWQWDLGTAIRGQRLANGPNLLARFRYMSIEDVPPGVLWILDKGLGGNDPDLTAFAEKRCSLLYQEAAA